MKRFRKLSAKQVKEREDVVRQALLKAFEGKLVRNEPPYDLYEYTLETTAGTLWITPTAFATSNTVGLHCRFDNVEAAVTLMHDTEVKFNQRLNPHSGKWNWYVTGDMVSIPRMAEILLTDFDATVKQRGLLFP